jgi:hypothetical protein
MRSIAALFLASAASVALAEDTPPPAPPAIMLVPSTVVASWPAEEARQGVAVDARYFYAISNNVIGKYDKKTGKRVAQWEGEGRLYPHMNSCVVDGPQLVCAASNHPSVPMASSVEFFDTATLRHVSSIALPPYPGSLTWIERHGQDWYAMFANYDPPGHGGEPGHDHRWTVLMRLDPQFRALQSWRFPEDILAKFAPMSCSGGSWGADGLLYVTGHDLAEMYVMKLPEAGTVLEHLATIPLPTRGQAFAWDRSRGRVIWSIDRKTRQVIESSVPTVGVTR